MILFRFLSIHNLTEILLRFQAFLEVSKDFAFKFLSTSFLIIYRCMSVLRVSGFRRMYMNILGASFSLYIDENSENKE